LWSINSQSIARTIPQMMTYPVCRCNDILETGELSKLEDRAMEIYTVPDQMLNRTMCISIKVIGSEMMIACLEKVENRAQELKCC